MVLVGVGVGVAVTVLVGVGVGVGVCVLVGVGVGVAVTVLVGVGVGVGVCVLVRVGVGVGVIVGVMVGVIVGVVVGVMVGVIVGVQVGVVMTLSSRVTAPFLASTRPATVVPVCTVIEVRARMLPTKLLPVPSVAELPTCQNTLHAWAPLIRLTVLLDAVMRVDPAWKINTASGLPSAFKVTVPVRPIEEVALYTPGTRV